MAKFRFRLATVLRLAESVRDQRRSQLGEAYRAEETLQRHETVLAEELSALRAVGRQAVAPGSVDLDRIVESQRYELAIRAQQKHLAMQRQALDDELKRRRGALLAANREVRVLEKLRERQDQRHCEEEMRREIRQLDEVAASRAGYGEDDA